MFSHHHKKFKFNWNSEQVKFITSHRMNITVEISFTETVLKKECTVASTLLPHIPAFSFFRKQQYKKLCVLHIVVLWVMTPCSLVLKLRIWFLHSYTQYWCPGSWYNDPGLPSAMADNSRCTSGNFWLQSPWNVLSIQMKPSHTWIFKCSRPWSVTRCAIPDVSREHCLTMKMKTLCSFRSIRKLNTQWHHVTSSMTCIISNTDVRPSNLTSHTGR